jgi:hypothetical protein
MLKELPRIALGDDLEPCQRVFGRVCSEQRAHLEHWKSGSQQCPAIGEVAVGCGAANVRLGSGRLDGEGHPLGQELSSGRDQGVSGAGLLAGTSGV